MRVNALASELRLRRLAASDLEAVVGIDAALGGRSRRAYFERRLAAPAAGEEVEVLGMAPEDDCMKEMFVIVGFAARKLGVPLVQIEPVKPDKATREAIKDWRYRVAMGYEF